MTESDGYRTVYATGWRHRESKPIRTKLSPDQAIAARAAYERGVKPRLIAIKFRATIWAVLDALETDESGDAA